LDSNPDGAGRNRAAKAEGRRMSIQETEQ
jgi:hypothetical protein